MLSPFWYDLNFHPCLLLILKCGIVINQCVGIGEQNELTYSISDMHRDLILTVTNALVRVSVPRLPSFVQKHCVLCTFCF
jgi:hypothetical protein